MKSTRKTATSLGFVAYSILLSSQLCSPLMVKAQDSQSGLTGSNFGSVLPQTRFGNPGSDLFHAPSPFSDKLGVSPGNSFENKDEGPYGGTGAFAAGNQFPSSSTGSGGSEVVVSNVERAWYKYLDPSLNLSRALEESEHKKLLSVVPMPLNIRGGDRRNDIRTVLLRADNTQDYACFKTIYGNLFGRSNALVLNISGRIVRVLNLNGREKDVLFKLPNGQVITVGPGSELIISKTLEAQELNICDGIARRGFTRVMKCGELQMAFAQFSHASAFELPEMKFYMANQQAKTVEALKATAAKLDEIRGKNNFRMALKPGERQQLAAQVKDKLSAVSPAKVALIIDKSKSDSAVKNKDVAKPKEIASSSNIKTKEAAAQNVKDLAKAKEEALKAKELAKAKEEAVKAKEIAKAKEEALQKAKAVAKAKEEAKKAEEIARAKEEAQKAKEIAKAKEEARQAEEVAKAKLEAKKAKELAKAKEEAKKAEEIARAKEEAKKAKELAKAKEEAKKAEEIAKAKEEALKAKELEKAEAQKALELAKAKEEARKAKELARAQEEAQKLQAKKAKEEAQKALEIAKAKELEVARKAKELAKKEREEAERVREIAKANEEAAKAKALAKAREDAARTREIARANEEAAKLAARESKLVRAAAIAKANESAIKANEAETKFHQLELAKANEDAAAKAKLAAKKKEELAHMKLIDRAKQMAIAAQSRNQTRAAAENLKLSEGVENSVKSNASKDAEGKPALAVAKPAELARALAEKMKEKQKRIAALSGKMKENISAKAAKVAEVTKASAAATFNPSPAPPEPPVVADQPARKLLPRKLPGPDTPPAIAKLLLDADREEKAAVALRKKADRCIEYSEGGMMNVDQQKRIMAQARDHLKKAAEAEERAQAYRHQAEIAETGRPPM